VGAPRDDDGALNAGAVWILFLNADGTVKAHQKISATSGGFPAALGSGAGFGTACAALGDLAGDGTLELAVGAPQSDHFAPAEGAVWILSLLPTGSVSAAVALRGSANAANGSGLARLADRNGDGVPELLVGAESASIPAGEFTDVHSAVAAANPGDVLLVAPGAYSQTSHLLIDRPLTLVGDGGPVVLSCPVTVTGIPAGTSAHVRGLELAHPYGLVLHENPGHVWIEDCSITVQPDFFAVQGTAIRVEDCADVVLVDTRAYGVDQYDIGKAIGDGLSVLASRVHAYGCLFEGGYALDSSTATEPGREGVYLNGAGAELLLSGCTVAGGDGVCSWPSCNGGAGVALVNAGGSASVVDSTLTPGTLAPDPFCGCVDSPASLGGFAALAGSPVRIASNAPVRENASLVLAHDGPPVAPVWLGWSLRGRGQFVPSLNGSALLGGSVGVIFAGTTDSTGHLDLILPVPPIVGGGSGIRVFMQALSVSPTTLGTGTLVLLLDRSL
jgi:hypothetical protein